MPGILISTLGTKSSIVGNVISTSADDGIYCNALYCIITNNNCSGSTAASGINILGGDQCILSNNICNSNFKYGILIDNTSDRVIITDNICLSNSTAQLLNNGTNTVASNNILV